jgi:hypothetical protein
MSMIVGCNHFAPCFDLSRTQTDEVLRIAVAGVLVPSVIPRQSFEDTGACRAEVSQVLILP